jgi:hypothetical protein
VHGTNGATWFTTGTPFWSFDVMVAGRNTITPSEAICGAAALLIQPTLSIVELRPEYD